MKIILLFVVFLIFILMHTILDNKFYYVIDKFIMGKKIKENYQKYVNMVFSYNIS